MYWTSWRNSIEGERRAHCRSVPSRRDAVLKEFADVAISYQTGKQPGLQRGFWESDNLVERPLKDLLESELSKLRNVPDDEKDWHPGSDQQVLDLVHPSM